ncbi:hypothetical protein JCM5350_002001 [Sporobolomyces pararoseus]
MPMNIQSSSTRCSRPTNPPSVPPPLSPQTPSDSASLTDRQSNELVVSQDFGEAEQATTTAEALNVQPERVEVTPPIPNEPPSSSSPTSLKLSLPPASPSQVSAKVTTTPPTPGSTTSMATASTGTTLDEFGLPRISPPRGYFDGDNEDGTGGAGSEGALGGVTPSTNGTG